jgi:hypothetical protein
MRRLLAPHYGVLVSPHAAPGLSQPAAGCGAHPSPQGLRIDFPGERKVCEVNFSAMEHAMSARKALQRLYREPLSMGLTAACYH